MVYNSKSEKETRNIAAELAETRIKNPSTRLRASVVTLEGELGAGKTTFVKGFAKALGIKTKVKSPTFVLMKKYKVAEPTTNNQQPTTHLFHLDCYRVRDHKDLATLDLKSLFNSHNNIILIEWPERISKILPKKLIKVHIDHISKSERKIEITNN